MALALEERAKKDDILIGDTPKAKRRKKRLVEMKARGRLWKHATLADIDGVVSPEEMADLFIFTMVRNPWDRVVSYYHWLRDQSFEHPDVTKAKSHSFEAFVIAPSVLRRLSSTPARHYMTDATGVEKCHAYIRLEHFEQDASPLVAHLGFAVSLPHLNVSQRDKDYRTYYSTRSHDVVAGACAEDIARFGYRFDTS